MKTILALIALMAASAQVVTLDLSQHTKLRYEETVTLTKGETLEVLLKENPSTGYIWEIFESDLEKENLKSVIHPIGHSFESDENRRGAVGVGGIRKMKFEVIGDYGHGDLKLIHGRPWETNAKIQAGEDISDRVQKIIPLEIVKRV